MVCSDNQDNEIEMKLLISLAALMFQFALLTPAHHSLAAEYSSNLITLNGTIIRFDWMNPHTRIYIDVSNAGGAAAKWECEGGAPGGLLSNGWSKGSLKPGDRVTIEGFPARDHLNICKARVVMLAGGGRLIMN
jgi:hypothetical protein